MRLRDDERGVTVQIGAILLFAILVILLSTYQAYVIPQENEKIEFQHSQDVASDLQSVRNSVVGAASTGSGRPESVKLGVQYPVRTFFVNPPPATGTLESETVGNGTVTISNVNASRDRETADFFGREGYSLNYSTKALVYRSDYNRYSNAPTRVIENGLLFNDFADVGTVPATSRQLLVDNTTITLVTLNGSYFENGVGAASVDPEVLSGPYSPIEVTNETAGPITITFPSRLSAADWRNRTSLNPTEQSHVLSVTQATNTSVRVVLEGGVNYTFRGAKIGVGEKTTGTSAAYITRVGSGTVRTGDSVTFEVRDKYHNPVSGVVVSVNTSSFDARNKTTGDDGRVSFEYTDSTSGTVTASIGNNTHSSDHVDFPTAPATSGTYGVHWVSGYGCDDPSSVCDIWTNKTTSGTFTAKVMKGSSSVAAANVDFGYNNSTLVQNLNPSDGSTNSSGMNETTLTVNATEGTLELYAASGGSSDTVKVRIHVPEGLVLRGTPVARDGPDGGTTPGGVEFDLHNNLGQQVTITSIHISSGAADTLTDGSQINNQPRSTEIYVESPDGNGYVDFAGGTSLPVTADLDQSSRHGSNPIIGSNSSATVYLYEFLNGNQNVNMSGKTVTVDVTYEVTGGATRTKTFNVTPVAASTGPGNHDPSVTITDISNSGNSGRFDVSYSASANGDGDLQSVTVQAQPFFGGQTLTQQQSISGETASGAITLSGSPNTFYVVTVTVTDADGRTSSDTQYHST